MLGPDLFQVMAKPSEFFFLSTYADLLQVIQVEFPVVITEVLRAFLNESVGGLVEFSHQ